MKTMTLNIFLCFLESRGWERRKSADLIISEKDGVKVVFNKANKKAALEISGVKVVNNRGAALTIEEMKEAGLFNVTPAAFNE